MVLLICMIAMIFTIREEVIYFSASLKNEPHSPLLRARRAIG
ncbi:MAG: hypothetical protein U5L45_25015 [Saprospiraceae bacterium]|nr:hypothetical protein [Saprospiraceae bacterium]